MLQSSTASALRDVIRKLIGDGHEISSFTIRRNKYQVFTAEKLL